MKECPDCQAIYEDDLLEVCSADGANLFEIPLPKKKEGSGWNLVIGLVGGFIISTILATLMFMAIFWFIGAWK